MMDEDSKEPVGSAMENDTEGGSQAMDEATDAPPPQDPKRPTRIRLPDTSKFPTAAQLMGGAKKAGNIYWDRSHYDSPAAQIKALGKSTTVYVGNLAFKTTTSHVTALFEVAGTIKRVVMGLDRHKKTPCGFAFVEFVYRFSAEAAISCLSGTKLDGRVIRVELDAGFKPGRQYGRGKSGGQVRDDRRTRDPDRMHDGGQQQQQQRNRYGGGGGQAGSYGHPGGYASFAPPPMQASQGNPIRWQPPVPAQDGAMVGDKRGRPGDGGGDGNDHNKYMRMDHD